MSRIKKALEEKDAEARKIVDELLPKIDLIPDEAVDEVANYVRGKLEVYEKALKPGNSNGVNGKTK
jgi:hypothetical protein